MPLDHLDTPLRLTWDLGGADRLDPVQLQRLADRIGEGQVFFLIILPGQGPAPDAELLSDLAGHGCQVALVAGRKALPLPAGLPLARLLVDAGDWLDAERFDQAGLAAALDGLCGAGYRPDLQLVPRPGLLARLPELIDFCAHHRIPSLKLPNLPLSAGRAPSPVGPDELAGLRRRLAAEPLAMEAGPQLEIHDLFLWELLTPGADRSGYAGCQAGNSVGHLDAEGLLYPCSSWPEPLGSLLRQPLHELWQSAGRSAILAQIATVPEECAGCSILSACFGGCRGLANAVRGAGGRDPMCGGCR